MNGLREALVRYWELLWHRERRENDHDRTDDRRRFWSEFREGQRQAQETSLQNAPSRSVGTQNRSAPQ